jgi:hypothetical protein
MTTKQKEKFTPGLHCLFVYNKKFAGKHEDEQHTKILYYYPTSIDINLQQKTVGLAEALAQFTK